MIRKPYTLNKTQSIRLKGYDNLSIIPYIRGRLVFAELAARAIEEGGFEQVIVDLPYFMNKGGLWEQAVKLFPHVSTLLIKKELSTFVSFPFVPNDAACIALASVHMLREWGGTIELQCIDDSRIIYYPDDSLFQPAVTLLDDYFAFTDGISEYFRSVYPQLENAWAGLNRNQVFFNEYRAGLLRERLKSALLNNRKTLFVCEYKLWWLIEKMLLPSYRKPVRYFSHTWNKMQAALVMEKPTNLWVKGALDDYPKIVDTFYKKVSTNRLGTFDKLDEISELIRHSLGSLQMQDSLSPSVRKVMTLQQYISNRLMGSLRYTPLAVTQLYDSAYSCLGKKHARELTKRCLDYPYTDDTKILKSYEIDHNVVTRMARVMHIPDTSIRTFLQTGSPQYSLDDVYDDMDQSEKKSRLLHMLYRTLSTIEEESLSQNTSFSWEVQRSFDFFESACTKARESIGRENSKKRIAKSWGSLKEGIDWKATIASQSTGENALYVKTMKIQNNHKGRTDLFTPVTFLFDEDMKGHWTTTLLDGNTEYLDYAAGKLSYHEARKKNSDYVESVFITYTNTQSLYGNHIYKYNLSSITLLYTKGIIGPQRYNNIVQRPDRFQCRTKPPQDQDIHHFSLSELGIAWAVKYAQDSVLVVARAGWKPSAQLKEFSEKRGVHIRRYSLSRFNQEFIERIKELHMVSRDMEKHPHRDLILSRFMD